MRAQILLVTFFLGGLTLGRLAGSVAGGEPELPVIAFVTRTTQVRSGPGAQHYPVAQLAAGSRVEVYRSAPGGWLGIRPPAGCFSWVAEGDLHVEPANSEVGRVASDGVRSWIGTALANVPKHVAQLELQAGERVRIIGKKDWVSPAGVVIDTWYKIAPPSGEFRWVQRSDVSREPPQPPLASSPPDRPAPDLESGLQEPHASPAEAQVAVSQLSATKANPSQAADSPTASLPAGEAAPEGPGPSGNAVVSLTMLESLLERLQELEAAAGEVPIGSGIRQRGQPRSQASPGPEATPDAARDTAPQLAAALARSIAADATEPAADPTSTASATPARPHPDQRSRPAVPLSPQEQAARARFAPQERRQLPAGEVSDLRAAAPVAPAVGYQAVKPAGESIADPARHGVVSSPLAGVPQTTQAAYQADPAGSAASGAAAAGGEPKAGPADPAAPEAAPRIAPEAAPRIAPEAAADTGGWRPAAAFRRQRLAGQLQTVGNEPEALENERAILDGRFAERLEAASVKLSAMVSLPAPQWDFRALRIEIGILEKSGQTPWERARARKLRDTLDQFAALQERLQPASGRAGQPRQAQSPARAVLQTPVFADEQPAAASGTERSGDAAVVADPSRAVANSPGNPDPQQQAQVVTGEVSRRGVLMPLESRKGKAPPFALLDDQGQIVQFITPAPGVNLNPFVRQRVAVGGAQQFLPGLNGSHLTANRARLIAR